MIRDYIKKWQDGELTTEERNELEKHLDQYFRGVKSVSDQDTARITATDSIIENEENLSCHD